MSQQQQDDAVMRFCSLTSATPEQARFFLESSAWNFQTAVENFFEDDSGHHLEQGHHQQAPAAEEYEEEEEETPVRQPGPPHGAGPLFDSGAGPFSGGGAVGEGRTNKPPKDKKASSSRAGIRTLSDLNRRSDSDNEDETQEYYTGGEKSGMLVQDPQKGNRVDAIFEQARRMGAQEGPSEPPSARPAGRSTFTGVGRTLTGEPVQQGDARVPVAAAPPRQTEPIIRNITFWRNGFTVDNGPLRRLDDPANAQFLMSISKSECPKELEPADRGTPVHVNLVRREEDWTAPPEPRHVAFQGVGRTLGSSSAPESGSTSTAVSARNEPSQGLTIDDSKPVTSIQLRLSDGTRMVARFNNHHTVDDIRHFIDAARPNNSRNYQLQIMGFPPKTLSNTSETIEAAGLMNAVVIQKA